MPTSGLDFENMPEDVKRQINLLPSMIYHGVRSESGVLLRMNSVPRSVAEALGERYATASDEGTMSVKSAREFLKGLAESDWGSAAPKNSAMSGNDYREVWRQLSGEGGV